MGEALRAWLGLAFLAVAMGLLLFLPAGTVRYWQAWVYLALFLGASLIITLYLMSRDPALLARRLKAGPTAEKEPSQKIAMLGASLGFIGLLTVPALDHRYMWSNVPLPTLAAGDVLVVLGFYITFLAFRENTFASGTIEIEPNQRVVSTGPYAIVRHPMYSGGLLYLLGTPLALGSYWAFAVLAAMFPFLLWRLLDEERLLGKNLRGYQKYRATVRWRLIPGVF